MSNQIPTHRVQQYSANVYHLVQQKGSKLKGLVRHETLKSKRAYFDSYGAVEAVEKTGRHSQTPQMDTPHSRRALTMRHYHWSDLIDDQDKIQMLHDPKSQYAKAASMAFGRRIDDVIIAAITGISYAGEEAETAVPFHNDQRIAAINAAGDAVSNLNLNALRFAKYNFDKEDLDMESLIMAVGASQIYALLGEDELTNSDYNTIKTLVNGEINTFMGFTFVMTNRLQEQDGTLNFTADGVIGGALDADGARICLAWVKDNIILGTGMGVQTKTSERDDLSYSQQVYVRMSIGATRLEEVKTLAIYCLES